MSLEVGKSRLEAMGDAEESADLIDYYCAPGRGGGRVRPADGADHAGRAEHRRAPAVRRLRLHRAVQLPARAVGRDVVRRAGRGQRGGLQAGRGHAPGPASGCTRSIATRGSRRACSTCSSATATPSATRSGSTPASMASCSPAPRRSGSGSTPASARASIKPCLLELGGKNAAIVMPSADLDAAAEGVMRSAFSLQNQKCSATSRVYVHRDVAAPFVERLLERTRAMRMGDPVRARRVLRPGDQRARGRALRARRRAGADGGRRAARRRAAHGRRVRPRPLRGAHGRAASARQLALPGGAVRALPGGRRGREPRRGARAGQRASSTASPPASSPAIAAEVERFFDEIEAGVCYANKRTGRHDRRVAGRPAVLRLEGLGVDGEGRLRAVLRRAVHARAEPNGIETSRVVIR